MSGYSRQKEMYYRATGMIAAIRSSERPTFLCDDKFNKSCSAIIHHLPFHLDLGILHNHHKKFYHHHVRQVH